VRVLIDYRPALRERTGAGEYTHQLVRALAQRYAANGAVLDLSIFSSSWKDRLRDITDLGGVSVIDRRVPVSLLNLAWHRLGWPPAELLAGGRFDVTHSSHPLILPARDAAHVVTIHDVNFLSHPERTRAEIRRDYPSLARDHAQRADRIIVSSAFAARDVEQRLGVAPEKIRVCPVGAPSWKARESAPPNGHILFVGTLEPRKNVGGLLDAYERLVASDAVRSANAFALPDLILVGKETGAARPWLDRINRPPLAGRVKHLGYVDPLRTRDLYAGAAVLVLPSFEEGFGIPVLEAMTVGVPVVASRRGSLPEVLGDAGLLVEPDRPEEIAGAIARLLGDSSLAAGCVTRGLARASAFRWDTTAERVYGVYREAMEHHARRH
jgi:glycosyltransferase involved in cell wall biosynthesis